MIREDLLRSSGEVTLISGLNFFQTEPTVLRDWLSKGFTRKGALAYLYIGRETFHPKVFVVQGRRESFALVGSGNLSAGGLRDNVECFVYVHKPKAIEQIVSWLRGIVSAPERCVPLSMDDITAYEPLWKRASRSRKNLHKQASEATRKILAVRQSQMEYWMQAISEAKAFFRSRDFNWHSDQKKAAKSILRLLHHPRYDFSREEWSQFYDIWNMGHLIPIYKYRVYKQKAKLRDALRLLARPEMAVAQRIDAVLDPAKKTHVSYLGINAASKILSSIEPKKWPVWNNPVKRALDAFGYRSPRGATPGQKYAAFAELMTQFMRDTKAPDMLALDCFFYWKDQTSQD
jgi:phosphatidylserine/phosphatidylglycerophosphate/cardiolipin synthase-like enzyme